MPHEKKRKDYTPEEKIAIRREKRAKKEKQQKAKAKRGY